MQPSVLAGLSAFAGSQAQRVTHRQPDDLGVLAGLERLVHRALAQGVDDVVARPRVGVGRTEVMLHPLPEIGQSHLSSIHTDTLVGSARTERSLGSGSQHPQTAQCRYDQGDAATLSVAGWKMEAWVTSSNSSAPPPGRGSPTRSRRPPRPSKARGKPSRPSATPWSWLRPA